MGDKIIDSFKNNPSIYIAYDECDEQDIQRELLYLDALKYDMYTDKLDDDSFKDAVLMIFFISNNFLTDEQLVIILNEGLDSDRPVLQVFLEDIKSLAMDNIIKSDYVLNRYKVSEIQYQKYFKQIIDDHSHWIVRKPKNDVIEDDTIWEILCDMIVDWGDNIEDVIFGRNNKLEDAVEKHVESYSDELESVTRKRSLFKDWFIPSVVLVLLLAISLLLIYVNLTYNFHAQGYDVDGIIRVIALKGIDFLIGLTILWLTARYSKYFYKVSQIKWLILFYSIFVFNIFIDAFWWRITYAGELADVILLIAILMYFAKAVESITDELNGKKQFEVFKLLLNIAIVSGVLLIIDAIILVVLLHMSILLFSLYTKRYYLLFSFFVMDFFLLFIMMLNSPYSFWRLVEFMDFSGFTQSHLDSYQEINALKMIKDGGLFGSIVSGNQDTFYLPIAMAGYAISIYNYTFGLIGVVLSGGAIFWFINRFISRTSRASSVLESDIRAIFTMFLIVIGTIGMMTSVGFVLPNSVGFPLLSSNSTWIYMAFFSYGLLENNRTEVKLVNVNKSLLIQLCVFVFGWFIIGYIYNLIV